MTESVAALQWFIPSSKLANCEKNLAINHHERERETETTAQCSRLPVQGLLVLVRRLVRISVPSVGLTSNNKIEERERERELFHPWI